MVFDSNRWLSYDDPCLALHRLVDRDGTPYLLLTGPEPDFQWERMTEAVRQLVVLLGVNLVVSAHGIPMAVPHTRPIGLTSHATDPRLIPLQDNPFGRVEVPGQPVVAARAAAGGVGPRRARVRRARAALPGPGRVRRRRRDRPQRDHRRHRPQPAHRRPRRPGRSQPGRDRPRDRGVRRGVAGDRRAGAPVRHLQRGPPEAQPAGHRRQRAAVGRRDRGRVRAVPARRGRRRGRRRGQPARLPSRRGPRDLAEGACVRGQGSLLGAAAQTLACLAREKL